MAFRSGFPEVFGSSGWNPIREFSRLQRRMDRVFDEMMEPWSRAFGTESTLALPSLSTTPSVSVSEEEMAFSPACDIRETEGHYLLSFDLPGVSKDDVRIEMQDRRLMVSGERHRELERREGSSRTQERYFGSFHRSFDLPLAVEAEKIQANYENGVLQIVLPKIEAMKPKMIPIGTEKGGIFSKALPQPKKAEKAA
jgi:HSP20 family protein